MSRRTQLAGIVLVLLIVGAAASAVVAADPATEPAPSTPADVSDHSENLPSDENVPETPEAFLDAFAALAGAEAYQEYTEFETIRDVGVSTVQVGTFDDETRREAAAIYELLILFEVAYERGQSGENEESLEAAERAAERADELQSMGASYAVLADLALDRFFGNHANELFEAAEETDRTTERLERLELASRAIEQTDQTDAYARISMQIEELSVELERDQERIEDAITDGETFADDCRDCTTARGALEESGLGVFGAYGASLDLRSELAESENLARGHGLEEPADRVEGLDRAIAEQQRGLAIASIGLLWGFLLTVGVVAAALTVRTVRWHEDVLESQTGNDVFAEEIRDA